MRVCLISTELFAHGMYGGFGAATRAVAQGLKARGVEVYIITNRRPGQKPVEVIDGITVVSWKGKAYIGPLKSRPYAALFKWIDADIYHSEEPSIGTYLAQIGAPDKKHVVTFRDPRRLDEQKAEWQEAGYGGISLARLELRYRSSYEFVKRAARRAHGKYGAAKVVIPRAMHLYGLKQPPGLLPTPVDVPKRDLVKAERPTVCYLARWDPRKRPEMFFELAKRFPEVHFIAMGACQPHFKDRDQQLRETYADVPNLSMPGLVFGEEKSKILEQSWVLINTSWREGLPISFIEAAAHRCAILSALDPDNFATQFGYWAQKDTIDDLEYGLNCLLQENRWKELGQRGQEYVSQVFETEQAIDRHIAVYEELLAK
jgi:glycosyltransferase involved in cell wall biosynthesis